MKIKEKPTALKLIAAVLSFLIISSVLPYFAVTASAAITPSTPQKDTDGVYQIGTAAELYGFAQLVNGGNTDQNTKAVLTADITVNKNLLSSLEFDENNNVTNGDNFVSWTPIGNNSNKYTGTFDGQGHTISGLYFNAPITDYVGLFGFLESGEIKNVGVIDSYFNGHWRVGGVCGCNRGTITGCYNAGTVSGSGYVGGVCGYNSSNGKITGCYNTGTVSGYERVGGVCGLNYSITATITGCYTNSDTKSVCGGGSGTEKDCAVKTDAEFKDGTVCLLLNTALINAKSDVRFYLGVKSPELIHAPQLVDGVYQIGTAAELYGFAQLVNRGGTDQNTKAVLTADIVVNKDVLKDDGNLADDTSAFTSWTPIGYYDSLFESVNYSGTFDGQNHTISGLYFNNRSTDFVGLFGCLGSGGEIKNVGVIDSYISGSDTIGGICGDNKGVITGCYNTGTVSGSGSAVGGVCGINIGKITGCYNTGTVSGTGSSGLYIGGVCGYNKNEGKITGCYNTGTVSGTGSSGLYTGGVCGYNKNEGKITGCYTNNGGVCGTNEGGTISSDCTEHKDADFADGTVCKLLNTALQNANSDVRFCQRIDTDASPLLTYQFESIDEHTATYTFDNNTFKATCLCGKKSKTMELTLTTEKTVVANGEENTLTAILSCYDNETVTYKWYQNDALIENATSNTYKMPTGLPLGTYTYKVQATMEDVGTIKQSVSVFVDNDPPTGEISIGTHTWTELLSNITFDLFFKEAQTVTITASDNSGEDVKIEYLLSHKELTAEELANEAFIPYSDTFSIDPDNEYVIYARITDESGNVAYISTNGIVLDSVVPLIFGIENGKTYCEEQTFTVTEDYLESVTVNGTPATLDESNQFTLKPAEGTQEIVVTDKAGNVSAEMIVTVNNGHTDKNPKDHKCDICGENVGTHEDIDNDHKCDYGCAETIGEHKDEDNDHKCDYGCAEAIGEHKALDGKHTCDYCGKEMTTCEDENPKDHKCDICGENVGTHEDIDKDHKCDYGCAEAIGEHKALDGKHTCDYCGKEMTTCEDENPKDHKCDICGENVGTHEDKDNDHKCDYCGETMSVCLGDVNGDGKVNIKDATEIQKATAMLVALADENRKAADVNDDGNVNVKDATAIQKHIAYIETGYKIGEYILLSQ